MEAALDEPFGGELSKEDLDNLRVKVREKRVELNEAEMAEIQQEFEPPPPPADQSDASATGASTEVTPDASTAAQDDVGTAGTSSGVSSAETTQETPEPSVEEAAAEPPEVEAETEPQPQPEWSRQGDALAKRIDAAQTSDELEGIKADIASTFGRGAHIRDFLEMKALERQEALVAAVPPEDED